MKFTFSIPQKAIDVAYEKVVNDAIKDTTIKGFRKGKAPRDKVISSIGESNLQQQAIEMALPEAYIAEVKKQKLTPISYPNIKLVKGSWGDTFEFEAEIAEAPKVELGDYKDKVKGSLAKSKIWTPDKADSQDKKDEPNEQAEVEEILRLLVDTIKVEVPQLLIDREVSRNLSQLLDQVNKLGINIDDYLASTNQTQETLKNKQAEAARQSLALEFILVEIAKDLKVEATNEDVEEFIKSVGDPKTREHLNSPNERANLFVILTKQKTIAQLRQMAC